MAVGAFEEELFGQHFLVCPFARRDRVFRIDTDIWAAPCVDTDPTSCAQGFAFASKQKTRLVHDAPAICLDIIIFLTSDPTARAASSGSNHRG